MSVTADVWNPVSTDVSTDVSALVARRRANRGRALHTLGLAALVWVSYGSYEMVRWAGVADPWAYLYPVIVDLGVVVVMPYSNDATLPLDGTWPVRRYARRTLLLAFGAILAFNALHTVLAALNADVVLPIWLRPVIALVAGSAPVLLYFRLMALHAMATGWEIAEAQHQQQLALAAQRAAAQRQQAEARSDTEADKAHQRKIEEIYANAAAQAQIEAAKTAPSRNGKPRDPEKTLPDPTGDPRLDQLVAAIPAAVTLKVERAKWLLREAWALDIELSGSRGGVLAGADKSVGRDAQRQLKDKEGLLPPSERAREYDESAQTPLLASA